MAEPHPSTEVLLRKLHEQPQVPLIDWLRAPAHVHYSAFRMTDPPTQRPQSRLEFQSLLEALKIAAETIVLRDNFGYGVKEVENGAGHAALARAPACTPPRPGPVREPYSRRTHERAHQFYAG